MNSSVSIDSGELPLVVLTITGTPVMEDLERALLAFDELLENRERYVLVMDVSAMGVIPSALRQRAARWLIEHSAEVTACCIGVFCIATTPLARAAIVAMEWLDPRGGKYTFVDTLEVAMKRARRIAAR